MASNTRLRDIMVAEEREQKWLAEVTGINPADISRIVSRGMEPRPREKRAIAEALGRDVDDLWPDEVAA